MPKAGDSTFPCLFTASLFLQCITDHLHGILSPPPLRKDGTWGARQLLSV
jgi:hypothetical protein